MSNKNMLPLLLSSAIGLTAALASGQARAQAASQQTGPTDETITTTIVFNVRHPDKLKNYIQETVTPGSAHYRDFLSVHKFVAQYAPAPGQIKKVQRYLSSYGISTDKVFADHLAITVSGPSSAFELAFQTQLDNFKANPNKHNRHQRKSFHRPNSQPRIPKLLRDNGVMGIVGLSNEYKFVPMHSSTAQLNTTSKLKVLSATSRTLATNYPGQFTVGDVANLYNINPLYAAGTNGSGTTVGIATYADFLPQDAYDYWDLIDLKYSANRISRMRVDGGGDFGADAGSGETSLDVEQAGGLAPNADVLVYDAPNSSVGGIDMFYQIVSDNKVDSLSYSWGLPEIFYSAPFNGGVDQTDTMTQLNQAFMEAAAQGISLFAASGDSGAYDTNARYPAPYFSTPLSVDWPSASPYMTAAGGTTLPVSITFYCGDGYYDVNVPTERAWGWDYLADLGQTCYGASPIQFGIFSSGDGGGVSVYWSRPWYQQGVGGVAKSEPGQSFTQLYTDPTIDFLDLPAQFAGRNVPDISMNADPETGYLLYSSADGGLVTGYGGTSFVAPQLNGITALINQANGGRIGLLAPQLYRLLGEYGYGPNSPFKDITDGDNWGYQSAVGYDQASGVGVPNVAQMSTLLSAPAGNHHHH